MKALMGQTGKESLRRQIMEIDPRTTSLDQALLAKKSIEPYDFSTVQAISVGLSMFYLFVSFFILKHQSRVPLLYFLWCNIT